MRESYLTEKENTEKVADLRAIGKFGVGLTEPLATIKLVSWEIKSRKGHSHQSAGSLDR
jgi:hypothetical protein